MFKKLSWQKNRKLNNEEAREMLTLEIAEVEEIAEKIFKRIDEKILALKSIEKKLDEKIELLESLLMKIEHIDIPDTHTADMRYKEIIVLSQKGMKADEIARLLEMPRGEIELILSLSSQ